MTLGSISSFRWSSQGQLGNLGPVYYQDLDCLAGLTEMAGICSLV
jgi:hypothetical protein